MDTRLAAVVQHVLGIATGFFERISENRHPLESLLVVDLLGNGFHCGREPGRVKGDRSKGVAEDVTEVNNFSCSTVSRDLRSLHRVFTANDPEREGHCCDGRSLGYGKFRL
jgi:hypothetical protein